MGQGANTPLSVFTAGLHDLRRNWGWYRYAGPGNSGLDQWPVSGLWIIGLFIGIDLIVAGWSQVMLSSAVRRLPVEVE
jgi:hypothetical protein